MYKFDELPYRDTFKEKPWDKDPHYFTDVHVSALALLKMAIHVRSSPNIEVMGLLLGKVSGRTMVVTDSFELPVEATQIRRNSHVRAYEYMKSHIAVADDFVVIIGWYHSDTDLSSIDVSAQLLNQQFPEPSLGIIVDPSSTIPSSKVRLCAFRTYSKVQHSFIRLCLLLTSMFI